MGSTLTQIPSGHLILEVVEKNHELLAFIGGSLTEHSMRWSVVQKEEVSEVHMFTDQSNLMYTFILIVVALE